MNTVMNAPHSVTSLARDDNSLAPYYRAFRVSERLLLTGHSHQAWPDCARDGMLACFEDAAKHVDDKWQAAFERADRVREGIRRWLGDPTATLVLGVNTHELVVRFLSALPLKARPRLVTSDAEFHSLRRQLDRLAEEGIEVVRVASAPVATLAERLAQALEIDPSRTAAVLVSSVLFTTSEIVPGLAQLAERSERVGASLLIDAYHQLGVVPFSSAGLERAFIVGGGYKYLELGEGNCFLRLPVDCTLRPVITGWFAEFGALDRSASHEVGYGAGALRFAGSTYDPCSHYRAASVLDFFAREGLSPSFLRDVSQHQVGSLAQAFDALDLDPTLIARASTTSLSGLGGFLSLRTPHAERLTHALTVRGVCVDHRGQILRLGPAPYLADRQLSQTVDALHDAVRNLS